MTVTRLEIAEHVADVFDRAPASRSELLAEAVKTRARTEVVQVLEQLPDQTFPNLRSLWAYLSDVPVDA
jgi:hypothetical protein